LGQFFTFLTFLRIVENVGVLRIIPVLGLFYLGLGEVYSGIFQDIPENNGENQAILRLEPAYSPKHVRNRRLFTAGQE